jgi:hypothetical protein
MKRLGRNGVFDQRNDSAEVDTSTILPTLVVMSTIPLII